LLKIRKAIKNGLHLFLLAKSAKLKGKLLDVRIDQKLHPTGLYLEAEEITEHGYLFAVHGEIEEKPHELLQKLIEKVKEGLSQKYILEEVFQGKVFHSFGDEVVGRIEHDEQEAEVPLVIIDGRPYSWKAFGKMVKANEGFQFKLEIKEITD
jgi:hypothetical protein